MKIIQKHYSTVNRWIRESYVHSWKYDVRDTEAFTKEGYCVCFVTGNVMDNDLRNIRESRNRFKTYTTQSFLNHLCSCGKIEPGQYWIRG